MSRTPTIVVCGRSCCSAGRFMLRSRHCTGRHPLLHFCPVHDDFGSYIHYPSELASTLEGHVLFVSEFIWN
ncbi:hypothetical protein SRHO_G00154310 [Serrasalmus rhombeus]